MKNSLENKDEKNLTGLLNHIKGPTLTVKKIPKKNHGIFQLHVEKKIQNTIEGFYLEVHENEPGISVTEVFINNVKMDCSDKLSVINSTQEFNKGLSEDDFNLLIFGTNDYKKIENENK